MPKLDQQDIDGKEMKVGLPVGGYNFKVEIRYQLYFEEEYILTLSIS